MNIENQIAAFFAIDRAKNAVPASLSDKHAEVMQVLIDHFNEPFDVIWDLIRSMVADADKGDV